MISLSTLFSICQSIRRCRSFIFIWQYFWKAFNMDISGSRFRRKETSSAITPSSRCILSCVSSRVWS